MYQNYSCNYLNCKVVCSDTSLLRRRCLGSSRNLSPPRSNVTSPKSVCVRRLWHKPTGTQYFHIFPTGCHSVKWFIHFIWWHHKWIWCLQGEISNLLLHCDRIPWSECSQFIKPDSTFSTARFLHWRYKTCMSHFIGFDRRKSLFPFLECIRVGHLDEMAKARLFSLLHVYRYILRRLDIRFLEIKLDI